MVETGVSAIHVPNTSCAGHANGCFKGAGVPTPLVELCAFAPWGQGFRGSQHPLNFEAKVKWPLKDDRGSV